MGGTLCETMIGFVLIFLNTLLAHAALYRLGMDVRAHEVAAWGLAFFGGALFLFLELAAVEYGVDVIKWLRRRAK